jgi:hypothetical protein
MISNKSSCRFGCPDQDSWEEDGSRGSCIEHAASSNLDVASFAKRAPQGVPVLRSVLGCCGGLIWGDQRVLGTASGERFGAYASS